jgi:hypothetical protein
MGVHTIQSKFPIRGLDSVWISPCLRGCAFQPLRNPVRASGRSERIVQLKLLFIMATRPE